MNYWNKEIECAPRSEIEALQSYRLSRTIRRVYENVAPYRKKMDEAGVRPEYKIYRRFVKVAFYDKAGPQKQLPLRYVCRTKLRGRKNTRIIGYNRQADSCRLYGS